MRLQEAGLRKGLCCKAGLSCQIDLLLPDAASPASTRGDLRMLMECTASTCKKQSIISKAELIQKAAHCQSM